MSLIGAAAITAGASLLNTAFQGYQNKVDKKFTKEMYERQLADSRENWNMQNEYNSPEQQMARLNAAGLNPNLVYGQGAVANSASLPGNVTPPSWHQTAPTVDASSLNVMAQMMSIKKMQLDNEGAELENDVKRLDYLKESANQPYYAEMALNEKLLKDYQVEKDKYDSWLAQEEYDLKDIKYQVKLYLHDLLPGYASDNPEAWRAGIAEILDTPAGRAILSEYKTPYAQYREIEKKINILDEELKLYPLKQQKLGAEAAYEVLKTSLAEQGININDPMWARILSIFLMHIMPDGIMQEASSLFKSVVPDFITKMFTGKPK